MLNNLPFAVPSPCGCGGQSTLGMGRRGGGGGGDGSKIAWNESSPGSATSTCGNVALSPINCGTCCSSVDVLPPYVPSPSDLAAAPVCTPI